MWANMQRLKLLPWVGEESGKGWPLPVANAKLIERKKSRGSSHSGAIDNRFGVFLVFAGQGGRTEISGVD